ncbi:hypothetical protein HAX54_046769, partial [Datura stramonium]|nr:hypothetical protein [Datura stramonium]
IAIKQDPWSLEVDFLDSHESDVVAPISLLPVATTDMPSAPLASPIVPEMFLHLPLSLCFL